MPASAVIRQASEADLPVIAEIIAAAYRRYLPRMDRPPAPMLRAPGLSFREQVEQPLGPRPAECVAGLPVHGESRHGVRPGVGAPPAVK